MVRVHKQIIAIGGELLVPGNALLRRYIVQQAVKRTPRVCFVPTASQDNPEEIEHFRSAFAWSDCVLSEVLLVRRALDDVAEVALNSDVIVVGGGNLIAMLQCWKEVGFDLILLEALKRNVVLSGSSAGMLCWFEQGLARVARDELRSVPGLAFLGGYACCHYRNQPGRASAFQRMLLSESDGSEAAYGVDDGVGLHFIDGRLHEAVRTSVGSCAYRITREQGKVDERPIPCRQLG
jgi:dipeptidase E